MEDWAPALGKLEKQVQVPLGSHPCQHTTGHGGSYVPWWTDACVFKAFTFCSRYTMNFLIPLTVPKQDKGSVGDFWCDIVEHWLLFCLLWEPTSFGQRVGLTVGRLRNDQWANERCGLLMVTGLQDMGETPEGWKADEVPRKEVDTSDHWLGAWT